MKHTMHARGTRGCDCALTRMVRGDDAVVEIAVREAVSERRQQRSAQRRHVAGC